MDLKRGWSLIIQHCIAFNLVSCHNDGDSTERICSMDFAVKDSIQQLINTCFGHWHPVSDQWSLCDDEGRLHCPAIKNVLSIIPSCHYCDHSIKTEECYRQQNTYTHCSVNNLLEKIKCKKEKGSCRHYMDLADGRHEVTKIPQETTKQTNVSPTPVPTDTQEVLANDYSWGKDKSGYGKRCKPCDCPQVEPQLGVSVGVAVGLLFLGVVIGTIVTSVICIFVPSLHSRTSLIRSKVTKRIQRPSPNNGRNQPAQDIDEPTADSTLPVGETISYPAVPSAPANPTGSSQAGYHTLNMMSNARDSHTYTGLQPQSPQNHEPMGGGDTYEDPAVQPMRGPRTVVSPVYQEFSDNIIPSSGKISKHNTDNSSSQNQPMRSAETSEAANDNYFVIEAENDARPVSDHPYFVLEQQNGQETSNNNNQNASDANYHDYFVLEGGKT